MIRLQAVFHIVVGLTHCCILTGCTSSNLANNDKEKIAVPIGKAKVIRNASLTQAFKRGAIYLQTTQVGGRKFSYRFAVNKLTSNKPKEIIFEKDSRYRIAGLVTVQYEGKLAIKPLMSKSPYKTSFIMKELENRGRQISEPPFYLPRRNESVNIGNSWFREFETVGPGFKTTSKWAMELTEFLEIKDSTAAKINCRGEITIEKKRGGSKERQIITGKVFWDLRGFPIFREFKILRAQT